MKIFIISPNVCCQRYALPIIALTGIYAPRKTI